MRGHLNRLQCLDPFVDESFVVSTYVHAIVAGACNHIVYIYQEASVVQLCKLFITRLTMVLNQRIFQLGQLG